MTVGPPWKRIAEFAVPMLLGNIAQQLYNTVDSIVVGKYVGDNALAAVGSSAPILNLLLALFVGVATGAGIVISQNFGAGDRKALSRSIGNCISLAAIASLLTMVIGTAIARPLLELLDTPISILDWCANYLTIFFLGAAGFTFYNILSGILRGLGDSVSALLFLLVATVLNIFLDLWFVAGLGMGVPGVALATVLAQGLSAILCFFKLLRMRDIFDLTPEMFKLRREAALRIVKIGIPSGLTQGIMAIAMLVVQSLTNSLGELVIACNVIIMRVDGFAMMPNMTFGQTMSVYTGQNVGAKRLDRVEMGLKQGGAMAIGFSASITVILLFFGHILFNFFTDTPELVDLAVRMMRILAFGYICIAVTQVLGGIMRGCGDTITPMWITMFTTVVLRIPVAYGLAYLTRCPEYPNGRPEALFCSLLVAWTMGAVVSYIVFRRGNWRRKALEITGGEQ
ncbi:MAG: MATE family efflux transporter [Oscillospiraceae bacterium]|nr:MATE family efflux transporter [Oscillospiraceae bacterium]MBQ4538444.1 MATE family efflux transporter [Oscillospiraceae bacterium]